MNHKQMVVLELLLRQAWPEEAFDIYFILMDDGMNALCAGNFLPDDVTTLPFFVDAEQLKADYNEYFENTKRSFKILESYKYDNKEIKLGALWDLTLNHMISFLAENNDTLNQYITEESIEEVIYNFYYEDDLLEAYSPLNGTYFPRFIDRKTEN